MTAIDVKALGVKHIMVCGHTNCGAIKAAITLPSTSALITNCWINQLRDIRNHHVDEFANKTLPQQVYHLVKLNVVQQVFSVCTSPVVQQMWAVGNEVIVHGLLYDVTNGNLSRLIGPISGNSQVPTRMSGSGTFTEATSTGPGCSASDMTMEDLLQRLAIEMRKNDSKDPDSALQKQMKSHLQFEEAAKKAEAH